MSIVRTTFAANRATATGPFSFAAGGGLRLTGSSIAGAPRIEASSFSDNSVTGEFFAVGGGIAQFAPLLTVVESTVTGNQVAGPGTSVGGGIEQAGFGNTALTLVYVTVAANAAPVGANLGAGQPVFVPPEQSAAGILHAFGTVVANPHGGGGNCGGELVPASDGYNVTTDGSCGFTAATDAANSPDPGLGPLADNGGPTLTMLPADSSPLVDAIPVAACQDDGAAGITTDQRGRPRPRGDGCDVGAVEIAAVTPVAVVLTPRFTG